MHMIKNPTPTPVLDQTVALRLSTEECRALYELARQEDRTVSYIIRAQLRKFLREQQRTA